MTEKHWLSTEKLVKLIEKSISPDSIVEHNVMLPDLTSTKNNKRQCDIVITTGSNNRQTKTIVEVQKRKSKFDINTFQGMVQKMRDVGAQHLICVSIAGFSKTIIEKARQSGGTIRLVTLNKHEPDNFPIKLPGLFVERIMSKLDIQEYPIIDFKSDTDISIRLDEMEFEISNIKEKFNYTKLAEYYVSNILKPKESLTHTINLPTKDFDLKIHYKNQVFNVALFRWKINVIVETHDIPVYAYSYEQIDSGSLAWVLESISTIDEKTRVIRMPLMQINNGLFRVRIIEISDKAST